MASRPCTCLCEDFAHEVWMHLTDEEAAFAVVLWEPQREWIERTLEDFDPENQSWRDYRNAAFDNLPDPVAGLAAKKLAESTFGRSGG